MRNDDEASSNSQELERENSSQQNSENPENIPQILLSSDIHEATKNEQLAENTGKKYEGGPDKEEAHNYIKQIVQAYFAPGQKRNPYSKEKRNYSKFVINFVPQENISVELIYTCIQEKIKPLYIKEYVSIKTGVVIVVEQGTMKLYQSYFPEKSEKNTQKRSSAKKLKSNIDENSAKTNQEQYTYLFLNKDKLVEVEFDKQQTNVPEKTIPTSARRKRKENSTEQKTPAQSKKPKSSSTLFNHPYKETDQRKIQKDKGKTTKKPDDKRSAEELSEKALIGNTSERQRKLDIDRQQTAAKEASYEDEKRKYVMKICSSIDGIKQSISETINFIKERNKKEIYQKYFNESDVSAFIEEVENYLSNLPDMKDKPIKNLNESYKTLKDYEEKLSVCQKTMEKLIEEAEREFLQLSSEEEDSKTSAKFTTRSSV